MRSWGWGIVAALGIAIVVGGVAGAQAPADASTVDTGDTAWLLLAAALVMLMTPGLALFYGGMVRAKNVVATLAQCFVILGLVTIQWAVVGYSLAFGPDVGGLVGNLDYAFLRGVSATEPNPAYAATVPHQAFMVFQAMFAVITPALIIGAFAERIKFSALVARPPEVKADPALNPNQPNHSSAAPRTTRGTLCVVIASLRCPIRGPK